MTWKRATVSSAVFEHRPELQDNQSQTLSFCFRGVQRGKVVGPFVLVLLSLLNCCLTSVDIYKKYATERQVLGAAGELRSAAAVRRLVSLILAGLRR